MNNPSIKVPLTEKELLIIASWINKLRDVHYDAPWSDDEVQLSLKFEQYSEALYHYPFNF